MAVSGSELPSNSVFYTIQDECQAAHMYTLLQVSFGCCLAVFPAFSFIKDLLYLSLSHGDCHTLTVYSVAESLLFGCRLNAFLRG